MLAVATMVAANPLAPAHAGAIQQQHHSKLHSQGADQRLWHIRQTSRRCSNANIFNFCFIVMQISGPFCRAGRRSMPLRQSEWGSAG